LNNKEDENGTAIVNFLFKSYTDEKKFGDVTRALNIVRKCLDKHSRAKVKLGQFSVRMLKNV
jgi:hypothetical protein